MDPRYTSWLTESQYRRKHDDLFREVVAYRPPVEPVWPRLVQASRRRIAHLLLALGTRLSDEPTAAAPPPEIEPVSPMP